MPNQLLKIGDFGIWSLSGEEKDESHYIGVILANVAVDSKRIYKELFRQSIEI